MEEKNVREEEIGAASSPLCIINTSSEEKKFLHFRMKETNAQAFTVNITLLKISLRCREIPKTCSLECKSIFIINDQSVDQFLLFSFEQTNDFCSQMKMSLSQRTMNNQLSLMFTHQLLNEKINKPQALKNTVVLCLKIITPSSPNLFTESTMCDISDRRRSKSNC